MIEEIKSFYKEKKVIIVHRIAEKTINFYCNKNPKKKDVSKLTKKTNCDCRLYAYLKND